MARPIGETPMLEGEAAIRFWKYLNRPPTQKEIEFGKVLEALFEEYGNIFDWG
ncbi:hypothetical protein [uncultured Methanobrevibacter sp.]|uniref:hypothetical protein n=1 Tax=uncultured Methanobrevibacter sp. TaxID=253161 RepID=UPI00262FB623|nr:hypothetical protein [uncultured Methanobrevibacter sp.]